MIKGRYSEHSTIESADDLTSDNIFVDTVASSEPATHTDRYSYVNTTTKKLCIADGETFSEVVDLLPNRDYVAQDTGLMYIYRDGEFQAVGGDYKAAEGIAITNREIAVKCDEETIITDTDGVLMLCQPTPVAGTYTLKATVSDEGAVTITWVPEA